jgi:molybdopterin molybdotransferase
MLEKIIMENRQMISVSEAQQIILTYFQPQNSEKVNIMDALNRVMAEDLFASHPIPPADNSAMDGFAVRHADTSKASKARPVDLAIIEEIRAGIVTSKNLHKGQAARIMTGAIIPAGADAIIRQEDCQWNAQTVSIYAPAKKGQDIRLAGEDVKKGELVIPQGTVIRPAAIGMLASLGHKAISVYRRPRVAIMATGDELIDIQTNPPRGKIVNSNSYALAAQVSVCGGIPVMLGIAGDNKVELKKKFKKALKADLIISSGGVSVGDYDFVKDVMKEIGNLMHFWQVAMRPGKPLAFGAVNGIPLFGLPGNPVSAMVSFEQFVRPALLKIQGHIKIFRRTISAVSAQEIRKKAGIKHFIRCIAIKKKDNYIVHTTGDQGSGILRSMVMANALIILDEKTALVKKNSPVNIQLLDDSVFLTEK